jgi:hypothetical protein
MASVDWHYFDDVERLRLDMDDDDARRYEQACAELVRLELPSELSQLRVLGREPIAVELEGARPNTKLVIRCRNPEGSVHSFDYPLWSEGRLRSESDHVAHPSAVAGILVANLAEPGEL